MEGGPSDVQISGLLFSFELWQSDFLVGNCGRSTGRMRDFLFRCD